MVVYVPGTEETDPKKQNMSLQQLGGGLTTATTDIATANTNIATNTTNIATNTTNIATNTTNIASNTTNVSALQTQTTGYESAWSAYTPTITASAGTFTSVSATGRYKKIGKTIFISISVTITTNGTASGFVKATLPAAAATAGAGNHVITGRGNASSGRMLQGRVLAASTTIDIFNNDGSYPGSTGEVMILSGVYESA